MTTPEEWEYAFAHSTMHSCPVTVMNTTAAPDYPEEPDVG